MFYLFSKKIFPIKKQKIYTKALIEMYNNGTLLPSMEMNTNNTLPGNVHK